METRSFLKKNRPIASIPILYKLFSRLLYNRLEKCLDPQQSMDQAGFRRGMSTIDHLYTIVMEQEIADYNALWGAVAHFCCARAPSLFPGRPWRARWRAVAAA